MQWNQCIPFKILYIWKLEKWLANKTIKCKWTYDNGKLVFFLRIYFYDWLFNWKFKAELLWLMGADLHDNEKIKYPGLLIHEARKKEYCLPWWLDKGNYSVSFQYYT